MTTSRPQRASAKAESARVERSETGSCQEVYLYDAETTWARVRVV